MTTPRIAAIVVSTRPKRHGPAIGTWVGEQLADRTDLDVSIVDLATIGLPLLDEPEPASARAYIHEHTKVWSEVVDGADGFILITPEHNRAMPASLKNALDCLYWEWANKPVGFVSYSGGTSGGIRAVEMIKQVVAALSMLPLNEMVNLPRIGSLIVDGVLQPSDGAAGMLHTLADSLSDHIDASRLLRSR